MEFSSGRSRTLRSEADKEALALDRMIETLKRPEKEWRSVKRLSFKAGLAESEAIDILRKNRDVVFSRSKRGELIARIKIG